MATRRQVFLAGALAALSVAYAHAQTRRAKIGLLGSRPQAQSIYGSGIVRGFADLVTGINIYECSSELFCLGPRLTPIKVAC